MVDLISGNHEVKRRMFGRTGLYVSEVSLGAMNLRTLADLKEADRLLQHVLDHGINLIDTARGYNGTNQAGETVESEVLVGNALRRRPPRSEPIVVVTKGHGYLRAAFDADLATSLDKLGVEGRGTGTLHIGEQEIRLVYFFHGINAERWQQMLSDGMPDRARKAKEQGLISHIGFSSHYGEADTIREALDTGVFEVVELPCNVYNRVLGGDGGPDLIRHAHDMGVAVINMKAFNGNAMPPMYRIIREYVDIDYETMLDFCLSNPYISTVDAGARTPEEFDLDMAVSRRERMSAKKRESLAVEADKVAGSMKGICRECLHCLEKFECPQGLNFPEILALYSRYRIVKSLGRDGSEYARQYRALARNATACTACGKCVPWCDYKLKIPQMMKQAHEALGDEETIQLEVS